MEKYRTALILGYGRSGRAAERLLLAEGTEVSVLTEETGEWPEISKMLGETHFDVCIVSPGFSSSHPWIKAVSDAGVQLLAELELGWSRHQGRTVAVTGSNGKSTAVKWLCDTLQQSGLSAEIGGNYGIPACDIVMDHPDLDWLVLEVSSFQLETVRNFRADVAILLNLLPNHLDRHETMAVYQLTKARIFEDRSNAGNTCIAPLHLAAALQHEVPGTHQWITFGDSPGADYYFEHGRVLHGSGAQVELANTCFDSPVLGGCTGAAVAAAADACGIPPAAVEAAARAFVPLPHRLQRVGVFEGVTYINDSKATNLAATAAAVQANGHHIRLISGGLPKESDYTFIKEILAERVRSIYLVGHASQAMYLAWNSVCPCVECGTLERAFGAARSAAESGDTILLSPGCASFDQFRSFAERGEHFIKLFQDIVHSEGDVS